MRRFVVIGVVLAFAGCEPSTSTYPSAKLAGRVTLAGAPIAKGRIHFMPNAGTPGVPVTAEISAGSYMAEDVPLGSVTVTFSAVKETGNMIREADREPYPETASIIPAKYAQGVPLAVSGDSDAQHFALETP